MELNADQLIHSIVSLIPLFSTRAQICQCRCGFNEDEVLFFHIVRHKFKPPAVISRQFLRKAPLSVTRTRALDENADVRQVNERFSAT